MTTFTTRTASKALIIALYCAVILIATSSQSFATFISPKMIMIEANENTGTMFIVNKSTETMAYSFEWQIRAQMPNDEVLLLESEADAPEGYRAVDPYLQFSPRRVVLKPGEGQRLRFLVRRTRDMEQGEYHSHLLVKADPLIDQGQNPNSAYAVRFKTYSAIPVFLRHGKTEIDFDILEHEFTKNEDGHNFLRLDITNRSTRTVTLNREIECTKADGNVENYTIPSLRIYTEAKRTNSPMRLPVNLPLEECTAMNLLLKPERDFQYKNAVIKEYRLK